MWRELNRQDIPAARCTVERLMRELNIAGAVRGRKAITTIPDEKAERAPDRVERASSPTHRTAPGSRASPTWRPGPASSTSPSSWTPSPTASWAGPPPRRRRPRSSRPPLNGSTGTATGAFTMRWATSRPSSTRTTTTSKRRNPRSQPLSEVSAEPGAMHRRYVDR
ncbi:MULTISPECIES: IS3 family transposase [unclassified Streptomyces]|uniref:IS3 family transposase n=1 Tax=unclassified Streptomyces TaxID=2593676 RepID=UPI0037955D81